VEELSVLKARTTRMFGVKENATLRFSLRCGGRRRLLKLLPFLRLPPPFSSLYRRIAVYYIHVRI